MTYDISEILKLPVDEQEEIANAIFRHLNSSNDGDMLIERELDKRFAKIKYGDYKEYTADERKEKLAANRQYRSSL